MSTKNFVSNGDAETLFTGIGNKLSTLKSGFTNLDNEVNGDATTYPYADVITIPDAVPANLAECNVKIDPDQNLHGYDKPWVGGAGKNKLPMTLDGIKAANTDGTWSGNEYTYNGIKITVQTDNDGNVIGIYTPAGTPSAVISFILYSGSSFPFDIDNTYILNGCPSGGSSGSFKIDVIYKKSMTDNVLCTDVGFGTSADYSVLDGATLIICRIVLYATEQTAKTFYPMIRLSTETDATFAPYTNICPITGHTEVDVQRDGNDVWAGNDTYTISSDGYVIPNTTISLPIGTYAFEYDCSNPNGLMQFEVFKNNSQQSKNCIYNSYGFNASTHNMVKFTINEAGTNLRLYTNNSSGASISNVRLYSTTQTYTIALGDTIYGGTVDFDSGVMTVTHAVVDMGTLTWAEQGNPNTYQAQISDMLTPTNDLLCSEYVAVDYSITSTNMPDKTIKSYGSSSGKFFYLKDSSYADATEVTTAMDGVQLYYPLATPTTIQLTPQQIQLLKGTNTLTASTGQISVTVNGVSGSIGAVQTQANATDVALAELAADIAEQLPTAPTTDGAYVLTVTVADGTPTYSWESAT